MIHDPVARLEEENAALKAALAEFTDVQFPTLTLTSSERRMLSALYKAQVVTKAAMRNAFYFDDPNGGPDSDKSFDVYSCRLRKLLSPLDIHIETIWGRGWRMSPEDKKKLAAYV